MDQADYIMMKIAEAVDKKDQSALAKYVTRRNDDGSVNKIRGGQGYRRGTFWNGFVPEAAGVLTGAALFEQGRKNLAPDISDIKNFTNIKVDNGFGDINGIKEGWNNLKTSIEQSPNRKKGMAYLLAGTLPIIAGTGMHEYAHRKYLKSQGANNVDLLGRITDADPKLLQEYQNWKNKRGE